MSKTAIGSGFEITLRILLMLDEVSPASLDESQIEAIDFMSVYAADFELMDENLPGDSLYRFGEFPARKSLVEPALNGLVLDSYADFSTAASGYRYSITDSGRQLSRKMTSTYADEYRIAVHAVAEKYGITDSGQMIRDINKLTIKSLEEAGHGQILS